MTKPMMATVRLIAKDEIHAVEIFREYNEILSSSKLVVFDGKCYKLDYSTGFFDEPGVILVYRECNPPLVL